MAGRNGVPVLAVLHRGTWYLPPIELSDPTHEPDAVDLVAVQELVDGLHPGPIPEPARSDAPGWGDWIETIPTIVTRPRDGFLVGEALDGAELLLDRRDVALLDGFSVRHWLGDVAGQLGVEEDEALRRVDRLLDAGVLRRAAEPEEVDPVGTDQRDAADPPAPGAEGARGRAEQEPAPSDGRIPVYAPWHDDIGPLLGLGMVTTFARQWNDGSLNELYDLRRTENVESFLAHLTAHVGPAVLLCSDYVWSVHDNLELAAEAKRINPELLVIHGGPSSPKFEGEASAFLLEHPNAADVLVRGEGEVTLAELLHALAPSLPVVDPDVLKEVPGLTFRGPDGVVRTADRPRMDDLGQLPSPYLCGEYDDVPDEKMSYLIVETNRGCPYGCTFCDWGSATMSRIRPFPMDRVRSELEWGARRGLPSLIFVDANFGIWSRDVQVAEIVAEMKRTHGYPLFAAWLPAKNTTKHLVRIAEIMLEAGISPYAALALQATDPDTLAAVGRENISTEHYVALAAAYRRLGLPLHGDLIIGLPGQTYESYRNDLQYLLDHEVMARTYLLRVLPNAPMNDPAYREQYGITVDQHAGVVTTTTMSEADRLRMLQLRKTEIIAERHGVLRHLLRWLQWDLAHPAMEVLAKLTDIAEHDPLRYPLITSVLSYFDLFPVLPVGRHAFYREVRAFVVDELGVEPSVELDTMLQLQIVLMPALGRSFPESVDLAHDYVAYYRSGTRHLATTGAATEPERPLRDWPAGTLTVTGDPMGICHAGVQFPGSSRDPLMEGDFFIGQMGSNELESPLMRRLPANVSKELTEPVEPDGSDDDLDGVPILIGATIRRKSAS